MAGALASAFVFTGGAWWQWAMAALCLLAGLYVARYKPARGLLFMSAGLVGACVSALVLRPQTAAFPDGEISFNGTVTSVSESRAGISAIVSVGKVAGRGCAPLRLRLVTDQGLSISGGDIIVFRGAPEACDKYAGVPFMGSSAIVDKADRLTATVLLPSEDIRIVGHDNSLIYRLSGLRDRLAESFYGSSLSPVTSSLVVAACLGTGDAHVDIKDRFRATGLSHLLCVSGFHVAIVTWLLSLILWPMKIWTTAGRLRFVLLVAGVWLFAVFTGCQPSAVRAATMVSAFYACRLVQRKAEPFNSLILAVGIMVTANPYCLYSIGFQLSVAAVAGLLLFAGPLNPARRNRPRLYRLFNIFTVPLAAMIGTAPVVLFWFHRLPLMSVPVNAVVTVFFPLFLLLAVLAVITGFSWLAAITDRFCDLLMRFCDYAVSFDGSIIDGIYMSPLSLAALLALVTLCGVALNIKSLRRRMALLAPVPAMLLVCLIPAGRASAELLGMGNSKGSQIAVRLGSKCNVLSHNGKVFVGMNEYIAANNIDSLTTHASGKLTVGDMTVAIASETTDKADILMLNRYFKGDVSALLTAATPRLVLLGADLDSRQTAAAEAQCRQRGIRVVNLKDKAVAIDLTPYLQRTSE